MTPERWKEIESVFHSALECAPGERAAFIDRECAGNEPLRAEVHALLSAESLSRDFLQNSAIETVAEGIAHRGTLAAGQLFGHYRVESRLGAGGMGEVYLAIDERTDRKVALKLLPDYLTKDEQRVRRFQQEARTVLALNHPNIVTTYEVGDLDGLSYIASEFIEGQTLREVFSQRQVDAREGVDLVMQIAGALNAAHDAGIVHRDIKPENIMLRPDGYVKILDFGVAKLNVEDTGLGGLPDATSPGILVGTARYMSPEQARGIDVDPRSDLWSLGVVFYEMLSGRVPFAGSTPSDCIAAILEKSPAPLQQVAEVPPKLQWIVNRLLRKDRDERYHTAREVLGDLRELKQEFDVQPTIEDGSARDYRQRISRVALDGKADHLRLQNLVRNKWAVAGALLVVGLLVFAGLKYMPAKKQTIDSLAVLPFVNVGSDPNSEYLADSLTESLINQLSQLPKMSSLGTQSFVIK